MKRIFYYSGYRLTVFHWEQDECIASFAFNPGEEGIDKFRTYLRATSNAPVRLLVDLIEEDFNKETIPHVGAGDRKSIVTRLIDRHYRKSHDYFQYRVIGREDSGRKDDILQYSVLSNPEILEPWLKPLHEEGTAVCGIWSLPLLTSKLYKHLDCYTTNVLVVSQQVPSNLRQTFLKNGHFESSRSAVVNLDEATIGEYISTETEQTIRFLSNQRHIGFDEKIEVHVICRRKDIDEIQSRCHDSLLRTFKYHELEEFQDTLGCTTQDSEYCNSIYSYLCSKLRLPVGHYGSRHIFQKYYEQLASIGLYAASILLFLFTLVSSFSFYSESNILENEISILETQTRAINRDYQKTLSHLTTNLQKSEMMQSAVLFYEKVRDYRNVSPQALMNRISRSLSNIDMSNTTISTFSWRQKQQTKVIPGIPVQASKGIDYASTTPIVHDATIGGQIDTSSVSIKQTVNLAHSILNSLKATENIQTLDVLHMPIDVRPESHLENEHGFEMNTPPSRKDTGKFEFRIVMKDRSS